jgi:hypothetical protein
MFGRMDALFRVFLPMREGRREARTTHTLVLCVAGRDGHA